MGNLLNIIGAIIIIIGIIIHYSGGIPRLRKFTRYNAVHRSNFSFHFLIALSTLLVMLLILLFYLIDRYI